MTSTLTDTGCTKNAHGPSEPGDGPCPLCRRPRCSAKSKGRHERCRRNPIPGGRTCTMHGSATEAARAAGEQKQLEDAAQKSIEKLWVGLSDATPVKDPVSAMEQLAGALQQLLDRVGLKVNEITHMAAGDSMAQIRGELVLLERVAALLVRLLDSMARLGLAERQVELQQEQAQLVTSAFLGALSVVAGLLPADRDAMVRAFLGGLGRGPELLEGAPA